MLCRLYHVRLYQSHQNSARLRLPYSLKAKLSVDIMWNSTNNFFLFYLGHLLQRSPSWTDVRPPATSILPCYTILYQFQRNNTITSECFQHELLCRSRCGICYFYYFLLEPVRSGKRWEEKSSTPFRGKMNHFAEFSYSLLSQACWSNLSRHQTVV